MTQRVFDTNNKKDMADLWDILPDECMRIVTRNGIFETCHGETIYYNNIDFKHIIKINWHDKTEITRPMPEAKFDDVGKLCVFWNEKEKNNFGILEEITSLNNELRFWKNNTSYNHCRRLTKQEIEELC